MSWQNKRTGARIDDTSLGNMARTKLEDVTESLKDIDMDIERTEKQLRLLRDTQALAHEDVAHWKRVVEAAELLEKELDR